MIPAGDFRFADPLILILLIVPPALLWWRWRRDASPTLVYSDARIFDGLRRGWRARLGEMPTALRATALALLVVAAARPVAEDRTEEILSEGVDIVIVLDQSGSMAAVDLGRKPDGYDPISRLDVAKRVTAQFIAGRHADRIGLVVFAGVAFTRCPVTLDYGLVEQILESVQITRRYDGTAIGMGLATAASRLRDGSAKSRIAILVTDGRNNTGEIDPVTAANLCRSLGIRVYTVGVGSEGVAPVPVNDPVFGPRYVYQPVDIDEETLREIAEITEGQYFRASDARSLEEIFTRIDTLEKTEVKMRERVRRSELFSPWAAGGALLLLLDILLSWTVLRVHP
jgi:Ca-activated chloride channel family protein